MSSLVALDSIRYAGLIEYRGTHYCGWQRQNHTEQSVQGQLERALSQIANHPIKVVCSGRTDKGVHAVSQAIHFDSSANRQLANWIRGANHCLPNDISVRHIQKVDADFHARYSATERSYHYYIHNDPVPSALYREITTHVETHLAEDRMCKASLELIGEHDFSSFRAAGCQSKTASRRMIKIDIWRTGRMVVCHFRANAFLQHMIRNICGALIDIGHKKKPVDWLVDLLAKRDRTACSKTAPANGLHLTDVVYPEKFALDFSVHQSEGFFR